ncbi:MAG: V-type ATP synthase subunit F [Thermodesulfovibrionales bacterium]
MKKIAFITPSDATYGFGLAGIPQFVGEAINAETMLKRAMTEPDNGLVIIDERMIAGVAEEDLRELEQGWHGILLVLPSPEKPPPEVEDYAARLIRKAIGYHMRLKL